MYPRVLDINNNLVAILNKAYQIGYTKIKNNLWTCQFTLPLNDKKNEHVKPKYFIELYEHDKRIGKFIVNPKLTVKNDNTKEITYYCEHVLSTLHSDVLFRYHQFTNFTTQEVLQGLMDEQEVKHWRLGNVAFTRRFHYAWENEDSLLNAIFSVPKPFDVPYLWTWDDSVYPFVLNLVEPLNTVKDVIAAGKNLKGIEIEEDPTNIVTRIYPLGAGEGINQLTIESVNDGLPYLQDNEAVAKYGIHKRVWVDQRFEDAISLKASAQAILDKYKEPIKSVHIECVDYTLYQRKRKKEIMGEYEVGDVLLVHDQDTNTHEEIRLEKIDKYDIYNAPDEIRFELGSVFEDISMTFTDLQKKQLVNETYSQGATNIDSRDFQDNCDPNYPAIIRFPIPDDVVNINEMSLTFETQPFRAYERAVKGGGAIATSTASGGATSVTSESGGGTSTSTQSGGGATETSSSNGTHRHRVFGYNRNEGVAPTDEWWQSYYAPRNADGTSAGLIYLAGTSGDIYTDSADGAHSHSVTVPAHTHSFSVPNHTHSVSVPAHTHDITVPDHTHEIEYGIFENSQRATSITIEIDGNVLPITSTSGDRIDLIPYLQKDSNGKIQRGRYVEIKLTPNNLARINATVTSRLFIQSRIGTVV